MHSEKITVRPMKTGPACTWPTQVTPRYKTSLSPSCHCSISGCWQSRKLELVYRPTHSHFNGISQSTLHLSTV